MVSHRQEPGGRRTQASGFIPGRLVQVGCDQAPGQTKASDRFRADIQAREGEAEPLFAKIRTGELLREFLLIPLTLKNLAACKIILSRPSVRHAGRLLVQGRSQAEYFLHSSV